MKIPISKKLPKPLHMAIATTTGFHLVYLAREICRCGIPLDYYSYHPKFRIKSDGVSDESSVSYFVGALPTSLLALQRVSKHLQLESVEYLLAKSDRLISQRLKPCATFVGLSGMSHMCALAAKNNYDAKIIIDRGSLHVLAQAHQVRNAPTPVLSDNYIQRELNSYAVADWIAVPSQAALNSFIKEGFPAGRLFVNPYGVDLQLLRPTNATSDRFTVGFLGNWSYQKGVDVLQEALTGMHDVDLLHGGTVGDIVYPRNARFRSLGHVHKQMLSKFFKNIDVLALPSRQDGFGLVMLEALASGVPVIASECTGGPDIRAVIENKESIRIVQVESVNQLREAILEQKCKWRKHSQSAARKIFSCRDEEYFSWRGYANRYLHFLGYEMP